MYGARLSRSGQVVERSTGLMTDFPTMSPVCLHNSWFGDNIIKGLEPFFFVLFFFTFLHFSPTSQELGN